MITDLTFYAAAIPAVILMGLAKGGLSGLSALSLPLMALAVSPVQAAAITLPILIVQDAVSVYAYRHTVDWRNIVIMMSGGIVGIVLGYVFAAEVSDASLRIMIGTIALAFAARQLSLGERAKTKPADVPRGVFWGGVAGFTSFIAHAGGPPFQVYVMPQKLPREVFAGTISVFFAIINLVKVPPYIALGQFSAVNMLTAAVLFPLAIVSTMAGVALVRRITGKSFYTIVYVLLVLVGLKLIYDGVTPFLSAWAANQGL